MQILDWLDKLYKKSTPGEWIHTGDVTPRAIDWHDAPDGHDPTSVVESEEDALFLVTLRNVFPQLMEVVRAAEELNLQAKDSDLKDALSNLEMKLREESEKHECPGCEGEDFISSNRAGAECMNPSCEYYSQPFTLSEITCEVKRRLRLILLRGESDPFPQFESTFKGWMVSQASPTVIRWSRGEEHFDFPLEVPNFPTEVLRSDKPVT
tara:strand:+ start:118283 stop:118909 length:627 start_codon:yes stop_codon:yes gene_type:complete